MTLSQTFPAARYSPLPMDDSLQGTQTPPPASRFAPPNETSRAEAQTADQTRKHPIPMTIASGRPQLDSGHSGGDTHTLTAAVISSPPATLKTSPMSETRAGNLFDGYLCLVADSLDDMERTRIAAENRLRSLTRAEADSDGEMRGLGLDVRSPQVAAASALVAGLIDLEQAQTKALQKAMKQHPLYGFVSSVKGVGEKQAARLLAAIGDPYWNDLHNRPRTVSELWAYCGLAVHDGRAQRRTKGVVSNWSNTAKMRAYVIAESIVKATIRKADDAPNEFTPDSRIALTEYGQVYLDRRTATLDRVHTTECVRCGPSGKPAQPGSPWSGAHQQADALRVVSKAVLKGLWLAARDLHEQEATDHDAR